MDADVPRKLRCASCMLQYRLPTDDGTGVMPPFLGQALYNFRMADHTEGG